MKTKVIHAFLWILVCMVLGITCYQCRDLRGYVILSGSMEPDSHRISGSCGFIEEGCTSRKYCYV